MEKISQVATATSTISIENRKKGSVTGIERVVAVNPTQITLQTGLGTLIISGNELKIDGFNQKDGTFFFEGTVDDLRYDKKKEPLIKRLFK